MSSVVRVKISPSCWAREYMSSTLSFDPLSDWAPAAERPGSVQSEKELLKAREAREKALEKDHKIENKAITKASRRRSSSTGRCNDGVYTSVRVRSQACRRDGGVREWFR